MRLSILNFTLLTFFATLAPASKLPHVRTLVSRSPPGGPCDTDRNCYLGANCCKNPNQNADSPYPKICKQGSCTGRPGNVGGPCEVDSNCGGGGVICCNRVCTLGSCRTDGSCDADNDCYGWCHNNPDGVCCISSGNLGKCNCKGSC